jgi:subtilisin family serine protease
MDTSTVARCPCREVGEAKDSCPALSRLQISVVDIFAPGQGILSAYNTSDTATATLSGTSLATPHVTGVVARFLQANPNASPATARNELVNNATLNHLSGIPSGTANRLLFWSSAR